VTIKATYKEVKKMTRLFLIRHGDTAWNVEEIFRGRADVELNEMGIKQAELLARYLADENIVAIYSSPLKRALKTAKIIAVSHHINVIPAAELIDFDYGEWQGLSHDTIKEKYQVLYAEWLNNPQLVQVPKGESLDDVRRRVLRLVDQVTAKHEDTIALVSHRVVGKVLICALLGLDNSHFWNIRLDTCGITTFTYESNRFVLTKHNETSFLRPLGGVTLGDF
jgi:broad specificity phosphatase PhoE